MCKLLKLVATLWNSARRRQNRCAKLTENCCERVLVKCSRARLEMQSVAWNGKFKQIAIQLNLKAAK